MSHTPGPWFHHYVAWVGEQCEGGDYNGAFGITTSSEPDFERSNERGDLVAYVPWDRDHAANARLIAAAPELLAAMKAAVSEMSGWDFSTTPDPGDTDFVLECKRIIAKAEGGE